MMAASACFPFSGAIRTTKPLAPAVRETGGYSGGKRRRDWLRLNPDVDRHARLLAFLDSHPLVGRIDLKAMAQA